MKGGIFRSSITSTFIDLMLSIILLILHQEVNYWWALLKFSVSKEEQWILFTSFRKTAINSLVAFVDAEAFFALVGPIWFFIEYDKHIAHVLHISHSLQQVFHGGHKICTIVCSNCIQPCIMSDPISCAVCETLLMLTTNTADSSSQPELIQWPVMATYESPVGICCERNRTGLLQHVLQLQHHILIQLIYHFGDLCPARHLKGTS